MNYTFPRTKSRGYSEQLWKPLNVDAIRSNSAFGFFRKFEWCPFTSGDWTKTNLNSATSTFAAVAGNFGVARLDSGDTTQHHGSSIQLGTSTNASFTPQAGGFLAMEFFLKFTTISTFPNLFFGFATVSTTPLSSTSTLNTTNMVGFNFLSAASGALSFQARAASSSGTAKTGLGTMADGVWSKLGVRIDGTGSASAWYNGVYAGSTNDITTGIPTGIMTPTICYTGGGTVEPVLDIGAGYVGFGYGGDFLA